MALIRCATLGDKQRLRRCAAEELLGPRLVAFHERIVRCSDGSILVRASQRTAGIEEKRASSVFSADHGRRPERKSGALVSLCLLFLAARRNDAIPKTTSARHPFRQPRTPH